MTAPRTPMTKTNHGASVPAPVLVDYQLIPVNVYPCRYCKSGPLEASDVSSSDYDDTRYRCQACGKVWIVDGADS